MSSRPTTRISSLPDRPRLRRSQLFSAIEPAAVDAILDQAEPRPFRRREVLFREGEPVEGLYLLAAGRVKLTQVTARGGEVILRLLAPGDVFAGVAALPGPDRYPVNAFGLTKGIAAFWPKELARRLVESDPGLLEGLLRTVSGQVRNAHWRLRDVSAERVPVRLAALLDRLAQHAGRPDPDGGVEIDFPLTRQEIAQMAGTTLYTVSRVLTEWSSRGWLDLGRERVTIRDAAALRRLAADG